MFRSIARAILFAAFSIVVVPALAGPLQKAFQALEVHNYFLARELFQKQTKKHPAAAWYGLSVISGRANNPFFSIDSCYAFVMRADAAFTATPDKERLYIGKSGVDHAAIEAQKSHAYDLAWEVSKGVNTIVSYDRYINTYLQSPHVAEATLIRDHLAFQQAREQNTSTAYLAFIEAYPSAHEVYEARNRFNEAVYRETTSDRSVASYQAFIDQHSESPYVRQAEDEIFRLETPGRTAAEYKAFITRHPRSHKVNDAWRAIYEQYTRDLSTNSITQFLQEFPDYPFVEELVDDYRTASLFLLPFRQDGKWGFIDDKGTERVKAQYEWVEPFEGGQALVGMNGRTGTINRGGRVVVPTEYDDVAEPAEGTSTVERAGKVGAVDRSGELVVPMVFSEVGEFSGGLAYAAGDGKYGYINARGEEVIPFQFVSAGTFHNGIAVVEVDSGFGAIDTRGSIVVPPQYEWVEGFENSLSRVRKDGRVGLIGPFGDVVLPVRYAHIGPFVDGLALVVESNKCGYVDMHGQVVVPVEYEAPEGVASYGDFRNGRAEVQVAGKRCLINTKNERVFSCQFTDIGPVTGALVPVRKKGKWGYANGKGTVLFDNKYDVAWEMINGRARVKSGELMGLIDSTGKEVVPPRYKDITETPFASFIVKSEGGSGLMDRTGKELIAPGYSAVVPIDARIVKVERNERFGYIDLVEGRFIWKEAGFDPPVSP